MGGTNRQVEGMFCPVRILLERQPETRIGLIEAQLFLSSYSTSEVVSFISSVPARPEVVQNIVLEAKNNMRRDFEEKNSRSLSFKAK